MTRPAVFVVEGVTMYLRETEVRRQLGGLAACAASGSRLTTDFYPPRDLGTAGDQRQNRIQHLARSGSGERLGLLVDPAAAADLVTACGWQVDRAIGMCDAGKVLIARTSGLPIAAVNNAKTLVAATRP